MELFSIKIRCTFQLVSTRVTFVWIEQCARQTDNIAVFFVFVHSECVFRLQLNVPLALREYPKAHVFVL